ncbi:MAG TPA: hypothetical protein VE571_03890 [Solirubrobacteraceae bacterium]|nr:hypothetical protein [Solirubrobacteraceae bacterium]
MSHSTLALLTVPIVTGVIGYVTNWTGVLMLFYPVHFKGWRVPGVQSLIRLLPHRIQQIPGVMLGGIGWQGIVPSRAAKMGSLAVDSGIAKIGRPSEFFNRLEPEKIAKQIIVSAQQELPEIIDGIMEREQPRLWHELPPQIKAMIERRVMVQLPEVVHGLTAEIGEHIEQLVDIKLMVIKRFDPELANRVFLDIGRRELTFIKDFGFAFGFVLGIPVAILTHFVTWWWLLPILGVGIGYVTNWVALWMIYEPAEPERWGPFRVHGLFVRRQHDVASVYATIVADEILTVSEFGSELLTGPQSDRTRALVEDALRPAIDRAVGPARRAVQVALGPAQYESIRESFATEPIDQMMEPLTDPAFSRAQSATMRKLITERIREMAPTDFAELLRTATREDEWLLLVHGAVLGLAGGLIHLAVFG